VRAALAVAGALVVAFFAVHALRAIRFPFPLDYAEGPLLEQARLVAAGQNIYRPLATDYPFTVANYPPVFPALLALVCKAFGFGYGVARVLTAVAAAACAFFVGRIAWTTTGDRLAGWVAAAAFLASPYTVFWSSLVRIDFLALAFSLSAILLVASRPDARATPAWAALLVALAVLTRQSHLLAGPLAITGALFARGRRPAALFVLVLAALVGTAVLALDAATRGGFLFHTVRANENRFSWPLLAYFLSDLPVASPVLLGLSAWLALARVRARAPAGVLLALYLAGATLSALTIGKVGSHVNYLLEMTAALAVFAGLAVAWARPRASVLVPALVLVQLAWLLGRTVLRPENMEAKLGMRGEFAELQAVLAKEPGPVLADETMGVLVLAAHPILLQPFEFTQLVREGVWDETNVLRDVRDHRFALILVNDGPATPASWTRERWTVAMLAAVHEAYEPSGVLAEATLYRPRRGPAP